MTRHDEPRRFPQFLGIGAQKAGTTWLHRMLSQHPDLWLPPIKEIHYFDRAHSKNHLSANGQASNLTRARSEAVARAKYWVTQSKLAPEKMSERLRCLDIVGASLLTDEWYASIFEFAPSQAICGEITPEYALVNDAAIAHMLRLKPELKFVFIMRDPVDRCWSALRMEDRRQRLGRAARLKRIRRPGFVAYSDYMKTILRYREFVAHDRLLLLFYDQVLHRPEEILRETCNFLRVDFSSVEFKGISEKIHVGSQEDLEPELYDALREALRPIYERLVPLQHPQIDEWCQKHYGSSW